MSLDNLPVKRDNEYEWNQFIKLGDMMGDGLHHEEPWIAKEYKRLAKILVPEIREVEKNRRKRKALNTDEQMKKLISVKTCQCGGSLRQSRSGSIIAYCNVCNTRFKATSKKAK